MFYVSIQWGSGPHYFVTSKPVEIHEACVIADGHIRRLKSRKKKRGANPIVRILKIRVETKDIKAES